MRQQTPLALNLLKVKNGLDNRDHFRQPNATDTGALLVRAAHRSPEMLPVIRPDNGSSGLEVPDLLRSLLNSLPREAHL